MSDVSLWPILVKSNVDANDYIPVTSKRRLQVASLFPSLATVGVGSEDLYTGITNQNQINFKGLLSLHAALTVATASSNLVLDIEEANIDLDLCDNTTSLFLNAVDLTSDVGATVLPVVNGGTGLAAIAKGALIYASATNTLSATAPLGTDGQILIGHTANGYPSVNTITGGTNVTVANGAGTITISAAVGILQATLDCDTFGINLNYAAGASWISGKGVSEGMTMDSLGRVFIGDSVPTLPTLVAQLTLGGNSSTAILLGNNNNYKNQFIKAVNASGATAGANLSIDAADGGTGNQSGGALSLKAGNGTGTGTSGDMNLSGGSDAGTTTAGNVNLKTYVAGSATTGLQVDTGQNVRIPNGFLRLSQTPQSLSGAGAIDVTSQITHVTTTGANALTLADGVEGQTKMIVMIVDAGDGTLTPTNFTGGATITFNDIGDSVHLLFTNSNWFIIGQNGVVIA